MFGVEATVGLQHVQPLNAVLMNDDGLDMARSTVGPTRPWSDHSPSLSKFMALSTSKVRKGAARKDIDKRAVNTEKTIKAYRT